MPELALPRILDVRVAVRELGRIFREAGVATAALDARLLVSHICALSPEEAIAKPSFSLSPDMAQRLKLAAERRLKGEPVSRIVGSREFWGLRFRLSPATLDPRPETELLVEAVLDYARRQGFADKPLRILDLGTGSGCLLAAILSELPRAKGVGVDVSEETLVTARENLRTLGLLDRGAFLCGDWAAAFGEGAFDIIVSNPPYIGSLAIAGLEREVSAFDPLLALDGGEDGFGAFRAILKDAFRVLDNTGFLVFENGSGQASAVRDLMVEAVGAPRYFEARVLCDLSSVERAVAGQRQSAAYDAQDKKKIGNPVLSG